jgi:hypothetical protein
VNNAGINGNDDSGGGNAFRHCLAACLVSRACGSSGRRSWDNREDQRRASGRIDYDNNQVGYRAAENPGECWDNCMSAWDNEELICGGSTCPPPDRGYPRPGPNW